MPPSNIAASRFATTHLTGLRPIGKSFDVADPAVAGLIVRVGPAPARSAGCFVINGTASERASPSGSFLRSGSPRCESSPSPTAARSSEESIRVPVPGQPKHLLLEQHAKLIQRANGQLVREMFNNLVTSQSLLLATNGLMMVIAIVFVAASMAIVFAPKAARAVDPNSVGH